MPTVKIFVLSHDLATLRLVPLSREFETIHLGSLAVGEYQSNQLGECRAFFQNFSGVDADFIGFANARWDQKYFQLHTRLHSLVEQTRRLAAPGWVLAPWPAHSWIDVTLHHHPTMKPLLDELLITMDITKNNHRLSLWANDFVCHRSVFLDWHRFWQTAFGHFYSKYGLELPFGKEGTDESRHAAFFFERITTAYFANRLDVRIAPFE